MSETFAGKFASMFTPPPPPSLSLISLQGVCQLHHCYDVLSDQYFTPRQTGCILVCDHGDVSECLLIHAHRLARLPVLLLYAKCKIKITKQKKNSLDLRIFLSSRFCSSDASRRTPTFCRAISSASSWVDLELLIRGRLNDPTRALARFTLTWPFPSEVPLSSDFASCVPHVVSSLPDASVFVVSAAAGVSTWLESCRSLFSAGRRATFCHTR